MKKHDRYLYAMNNPLEPLDWEIPFLKSMGFDGFELTLEPPLSFLEQAESHRQLVLDFVRIGHTRCDLNFASEIAAERDFAIETMMLSLDKFQSFGVRQVNYHPDRGSRSLSKEDILRYNVESLNTLIPYAQTRGIKLMVENQPPYPNASDLKRFRDAIDYPFYLLLDLAHAFCYSGDDGTIELIETFGNEIEHVHVSDNRGQQDEHLFPGYGAVDFARYFKHLNSYIKDNVNYSIESFRIEKNGALHTVTRDERVVYLSEAVVYLKDLIKNS